MNWLGLILFFSSVTIAAGQDTMTAISAKLSATDSKPILNLRVTGKTARILFRQLSEITAHAPVGNSLGVEDHKTGKDVICYRMVIPKEPYACESRMVGGLFLEGSSKSVTESIDKSGHIEFTKSSKEGDALFTITGRDLIVALINQLKLDSPGIVKIAKDKEGIVYDSPALHCSESRCSFAVTHRGGFVNATP